MDAEDILFQFETEVGFCRAAMVAAVANREEVTPGLLRILERAIHQTAEVVESGSMAQFYALFLLAQFREVRAYPLLIRLALLPDPQLDALWGEFMTDDLANILASVCGGDAAPIQSLIENEEACEWTRAAAVESLVLLATSGQKSRDEIVSYFAGLFHGKLRRKWSYVWEQLVSSCCDFCPDELLADLKLACDEGLTHEYSDAEELESALALGQRQTIRFAAAERRHLIDDAVGEMHDWIHFQAGDWSDGPDRESGEIGPAAEPPKDYYYPNPGSGQLVKTSNVGRNDPCPCGSGKKYKKCCGG